MKTVIAFCLALPVVAGCAKSPRPGPSSTAVAPALAADAAERSDSSDAATLVDAPAVDASDPDARHGRPPFEITIHRAGVSDAGAGRRITLRFFQPRIGRKDYDAEGVGGVASMSVDDQAIYPAACDATPTLASLCTKAFRELTPVDLDGVSPYSIQLLDNYSDGMKADFLFMGQFPSTDDCGIYGLWLIRVTASQIRVTQPVGSCLHFNIDPSNPVPRDQLPQWSWGPPIRLMVSDAYNVTDLRRRLLLLDEAPFEFVAAGLIP